MHKFVPNTQTVNPDREYFIHEGLFYKYDNNVDRGMHEVLIMRKLDHRSVPKIKDSFVENSQHVIVMERIPGETLENFKLTPIQKHQVVMSLFELYSYLLNMGIIHGDINVSNVIYDPCTLRLGVIDWEMGRDVRYDDPDIFHDLYGPPWGIIDLLRKI